MAASSQTPTPGLASDAPNAKASDSSIDQALTLLLADQTEAALRWGAAALQRDPSTSSALVVTSRLLERMGRTRVATEGLNTAVKRAIAAGNLPLAIAAIDELRALGEDVDELFDRVSETFCDGSPRLDETPAPLSPHFDDFQPLSSFLTGPALASQAAQIVQTATSADDEGAPPAELPPVARLPLFSALPKDALRDLLAAFDVITVPAGHRVMEEGELGAAAYIVARGELVLLRASGTKPPVVLARLGSGAFFGEMALVSDMPRAASAVATRPSILLVATREGLDAVARRHPVVAVELALHCHRRLVANLGRMAPMLAALPPADRAAIVDRFVTRIYAKGERLATKGEEIGGLHLLASGAVAVVAHDESERVVLATLSAGETIGEVELVLCRRANADAIALQPTVTLFLSREDFAGLMLDHPALVHGLYVTAVRRDGETAQALESATFTANDYQLDDILLDEPHLSSETRLDAPAYHEVHDPGVPSAEESERPAASRSAAISVPPALPTLASANEPARVTAVTAPFPPVMVSLPLVEEPPAQVGAATASAPATPPPAARAPTVEEALRSVTPPPFSSLYPLMASRPAVGSAPPASRARPFRDLPPVAVFGVFAAVAVLGFALAAPFSNHVNTAAASGGGDQNAAVPVEPPAPPRVEPVPEKAPVPIVAAAPTAAPAAPAETAPPAPRRAVATTHSRSAPSPTAADLATIAADLAPASAAPTAGAAASAPAVAAASARSGPKTTSGAPRADEFGGRE